MDTLKSCKAMQMSDQMVCSCGNTWDMNDPDPPKCVRLATRPDILTVSGTYFNFIDVDPDTFNIYDIAVGLSNECRFAGQLEDFYSVAQHSVIVSKIVPEEDALEGLMHDAAEALIHDITRPFKQLLPDYRAIEARVEPIVMKKFGVKYPFPASVKKADMIALATEERDLAPKHKDQWGIISSITPLKERIKPLSPADAKWLFLNRFDCLMGRKRTRMSTTYKRYWSPVFGHWFLRGFLAGRKVGTMGIDHN